MAWARLGVLSVDPSIPAGNAALPRSSALCQGLKSLAPISVAKSGWVSEVDHAEIREPPVADDGEEPLALAEASGLEGIVSKRRDRPATAPLKLNACRPSRSTRLGSAGRAWPHRFSTITLAASLWGLIDGSGHLGQQQIGRLPLVVRALPR
jgi:hypothetical protein